MTPSRAETLLSRLCLDPSRADRVTDAVVRAAKFPERNREGIVGTLQRLKDAAETDAARA